MAPQSDPFEGAHTLPRPEVNPLLNPLLAENMGRWAEVYFTSAPEKREEAVLELLRELEAEKPGREAARNPLPSVAPPENPPGPYPEPAQGVWSAEDQQRSTRCRGCGHDNPPSHQFCGMCGEKLELDVAPAESKLGAARAEHVEGENPGDRIPGSSHPESGHDSLSHAQTFDDANELALFRRVSEGAFRDSSAASADEPRPSRPYRIYIVAALAIVILVLGYVAWRGTRSGPISHEESPPPPVVATEVGTPTVPGATNIASNKGNARGPTDSPAGLTSGIARSEPQAPILQGNGSEELAIAQRYLSGGTDLEPNSAEAAKWLWKSIAKHNAEATLLLADLYLKGDGVSKNCDQALVLLDEAARKGLTGAGERLRNLAAFGCQ